VAAGPRDRAPTQVGGDYLGLGLGRVEGANTTVAVMWQAGKVHHKITTFTHKCWVVLLDLPTYLPTESYPIPLLYHV
jgi:hypothetical protein